MAIISERERIYLNQSNLKTEKLSGKAKLSTLLQTIIVPSNHTTVLFCVWLLQADPVPETQCAACGTEHCLQHRPDC